MFATFFIVIKCKTVKMYSKNRKLVFILFLLFTLKIYSPPLFGSEVPENNIYQLLFSGQYHTAIEILEEYVGSDSCQAQHYFLLGIAHSFQNNHQEALSCFLTSAHMDSQNVNNLHYLANTYSKLGYLNQAENTFKSAIRIDSARVDLWDNLGKIYYRKSNYKEANRIYTRLIKIEQSSYYYHMKGRCAARMDSLDNAVYYYKLAHNKDPRNIEVILELSRNLFSQDSLDSAFNYIQEGILYDRKNRHLHRLKADILYKKKEYTFATLSFLDAIVFGDNSVDGLKKMGFCYFSDKNYLKSKATFELSLTLDDKDPVILYYLGICCRQLNEIGNAQHYLNKALTLLQPDYMNDLYLVRADCFYEEKEYIEAIKNFRKALEKSKNKQVVYYSLANVYYDYYKDRNIPLIYYKKALLNEISPEITNFIKQRIQELTQDVFFSQSQ